MMLYPLLELAVFICQIMTCGADVGVNITREIPTGSSTIYDITIDKGTEGAILFSTSLGLSRCTAEGKVEEIVGGDVLGYKEGFASLAEFNQVTAVECVTADEAIVADQQNHCLRRIALSTRYSSSFVGECMQVGDVDGKQARLNSPVDLEYDEFAAKLYLLEYSRKLKVVEMLASTVETLIFLGEIGNALLLRSASDILFSTATAVKILNLTSLDVTVLAGADISGRAVWTLAGTRFDGPWKMVNLPNAHLLLVADVWNARLVALDQLTNMSHEVRCLGPRNLPCYTPGAMVISWVRDQFYLVDEHNNILVANVPCYTSSPEGCFLSSDVCLQDPGSCRDPELKTPCLLISQWSEWTACYELVSGQPMRVRERLLGASCGSEEEQMSCASADPSQDGDRDVFKAGAEETADCVPPEPFERLTVRTNMECSFNCYSRQPVCNAFLMDASARENCLLVTLEKREKPFCLLNLFVLN